MAKEITKEDIEKHIAIHKAIAKSEREKIEADRKKYNKDDN